MLYQTDVQIDAIVDINEVTLSDVLWALGIIVAAIIAAAILKRYVEKRLLQIEGLPDPIAKLAVRLTVYSVFMVGVVIALPHLGFQMEPLLVLVLILGVLFFFAARPLMENFSAGLVIMTRSPYIVGDLIEHDGLRGTVRDIDGRETIFTAISGETYRVPNTSILSSPIINLTAAGHQRSEIGVGVAYGTDLDRVVEVLKAAVSHLDHVLEVPHPMVGVVEYGDSAIEIEVWIWHLPTGRDRFWATDEAIRSINRAFSAEGITIPFPQRDVRMRSTGPSEDE